MTYKKQHRTHLSSIFRYRCWNIVLFFGTFIFPQLIYSQQSSTPSDQKLIEGLNSLIEYINRSTDQNRNLQLALKNYNYEANFHQGVDFSNQIVKSNLTYEQVEYDIEKQPNILELFATSQLSKDNVNRLDQVFSTLYSIQDELNTLQANMIKYIKNGEYLNDQLKKSNEIMERFDLLFRTYDQSKTDCYELILFISEINLNPDMDNLYYQNAEIIRSAIAQVKSVLNQIKEIYYSKKSLTSEELTVSYTKLQQKLYDPIDELKEWNKEIENSPKYYNLYNERIINHMRDFFQKIVEEDTSLVGVPLVNRFVFFYNEMINDYNTFSSELRISLLRNIKEPHLFDLRPKKINLASTVDSPNLMGEDVYSLEGHAPSNIVLLLDVSASMSNKIGLVRDAMLKLIPILRKVDKVSIIVYSAKARIIFPTKKAKSKEEMKEVVRNLSTEGGTSGNTGIELAYVVAKDNYISDGNNRIILATDGEFNVKGKSLKLAKQGINQNIELSIFDFTSRKNPSKELEELALSGNGNYVRITRENLDRALLYETKAF